VVAEMTNPGRIGGRAGHRDRPPTLCSDFLVARRASGARYRNRRPCCHGRCVVAGTVKAFAYRAIPLGLVADLPRRDAGCGTAVRLPYRCGKTSLSRIFLLVKVDVPIEFHCRRTLFVRGGQAIVLIATIERLVPVADWRLSVVNEIGPEELRAPSAPALLSDATDPLRGRHQQTRRCGQYHRSRGIQRSTR
jgi:hypothetical protein